MRAKEFIIEVFNTQAAGEWEDNPNQFAGMENFKFTASNGIQYQLYFVEPIVGPEEMGPELFDFADNVDNAVFDKFSDRARFMEFEQVNLADQDVPGKQGIEGTGSAAEVFGIVVNATLAYIKKHQPSMLYFQAVEPNRRRLYAAMIARLLKSLPGWAAEQSGPGNSHFAVYNKSLLGPA